jgi:hypothetical protein
MPLFISGSEISDGIIVAELCDVEFSSLKSHATQEEQHVHFAF